MLAGLAQQVDGVVVELHPAFTVSGRVVQPDGKPCLEAELSLEGDDHSSTIVRGLVFWRSPSASFQRIRHLS